MRGIERVLAWFEAKNRTPFEFQRKTWDLYVAGHSGLVQAPTGMGKTIAAAAGPMIEFIDALPVAPKRQSTAAVKRKNSAPLAMLWITPLRALAADTSQSLQELVDALQLPWSIELRTSDTSASIRKRQRERLPTVLITTPESVSLLLSYPGVPERFSSLRAIIVDEWHELMSSKRGVQTELALARMRFLNSNVRIWGLSATLANPGDAAATLLGPKLAHDAHLVSAPDDKAISVESILPADITRFPWAGHLGLRLVNDVIKQIDKAQTTLVFSNTRSQSEVWFRALIQARPDWIGDIGLHHGSIDRKIRQSVEELLRTNQLRAVVCTSSLDLGVDFWPVDQVIQIGSPKSVARVMQRAGRSGHQPGATSRVICVPTQAFELIEFSAARHAVECRRVESREPIRLALDVLAQHVVTLASGDGFNADELLNEVRSTLSFAGLSDEQWQWVLDFAHRGGPTLTAYPNFARIKQITPGNWGIASEAIARAHRTNIGTIASDGMVTVQFLKGRKLGSIEESFIARLKPGDTFIFSGRVLEFRRMHDMVAHVRKSSSKKGTIPRWSGGRLPISQSLADEVCQRLDQAAVGQYNDAEMKKIQPLLEVQARWSAIPRLGQMLIESTQTRDGHHHYIYPFLGRLVHEGLAALVAFRFGMRGHRPITATFNDYGIELLGQTPLPQGDEDYRAVLSPDALLDDILAALNTGELARRHFREIARIAGLLVPARPGGHKTARQLQASSGLFYDVFVEFDPENLLLVQARREVLERQLEFARLREALLSLKLKSLVFRKTERLTPMAFPLWAERIASQQLRFESAGERIERIAHQLELAAGDP